MKTLERARLHSRKYLYRVCSSQATETNAHLDNFNANKLINAIYFDVKLEGSEQHKAAISKIFEIYDEIDEARNRFIVNKMLRIFWDLNCPHHVLKIWGDIEILHENSKDECADITYAQLLKCCIKSDEIGISKCIQALKWMRNSSYKLKTQNNIIIKLITKCNDLESLNYVHSLWKNTAIECTKKDNNDIAIDTALIRAFGNCKDIETGRNIFNCLHKTDTICLNTMLHALIHNGCHDDALHLYSQYPSLIDHVSLSLMTRVCSDADDNVATRNILDSAACSDNIHVQTNLIEYYGNNRDLDNALNVYNSIPVDARDAVSTCALMKIYLNNANYAQVLQLYESIVHTSRDDVCHLLAIKACTNLKNESTATATASRIVKGMDVSVDLCNINVKNALIEMYGCFGDVCRAQYIYDSIDDNDENISSNTMMKVYLNNGLHTDALKVYDIMDDRNIAKDDISHVAAIEACTKLLEYNRGIQIHLNILQHTSIQIKTALIHFYANCKDVENALNIFKSIADDEQSIMSVGCMMDAYCTNNHNYECIQLFKDLSDVYNLKPNIVCYSILFTACSNSTAFYFGQATHHHLKENTCTTNQCILKDSCIEAVLINLYGKCGMIHLSKEIFDESSNKDEEIVVWNAMMNAYGRNGEFEEAKCLFNAMVQRVGVVSDSYAILLNGCSHDGNVNEARDIWNHYINEDDMKYDCFVMSSFVDCLSRNGFLDEALQYIEKYEKYGNNKADHVMWMSVLSGCNKYQNKKVGKYAYDQYVHKFGDNKIYRRKLGSASALFANINATESAHLKSTKLSQFSDIDIFGTLYKFYAQCNDTQVKQHLTEILPQLVPHGYNNAMDTECMEHSEKWAAIYALLHTPKDYVIIINNNLSICDDCHRFMTAISQVEQRKLIISDKDRVHVFERGQCNCSNTRLSK